MSRLAVTWSVVCLALALAASVSADPLIPTQPADTCDNQFPGDANGDFKINVGDAAYLMSYLYHGGPAPLTLANGDINGDCEINYEDVHFILCVSGVGVCIPEIDYTPVTCTCVDPVPDFRDTCEAQYPGDADGNGVINREDVLYLYAYLCQDGPAPDPLGNGDPNGDCVVDSLDVDYLMDALLYGGPAPVACTCLEPPTGSCYVDYCVHENPGDLDGNGSYNVGDAVYMLNWLIKGGAKPNPIANADVNGDCLVNYDDFACLIQYILPCRVTCTCIFPEVETPCNGALLAGDANNDGKFNVADAVYIITHVFRGGSAPTPYPIYSGDPNADCAVNIGDAVYIINHVFRGGAAPVDCYQWQMECGSPVH